MACQLILGDQGECDFRLNGGVFKLGLLEDDW